MKIVACNSNRPLAEAVAATLKLPLTRASIRRFADMEVFVEIHENVRGEDVFVVQPTSYPANDTLMELLVTLDALRRSSARRITAVMPYFGYARQDRKTASRSPISAKLVANLITEAGANRVLTMDLHAAQIQGFFDIPVDNLYAAPLVQPRHPGALPRPRPDDRVTRCGRRAARAAAGDAAELRSRHHRQAPRARRAIRGDERDRRCRRARLHPGGRPGRLGRHALQRGRGTDQGRVRARPARMSRMACCRVAQWRASRRRRSRRW